MRRANGWAKGSARWAAAAALAGLLLAAGGVRGGAAAAAPDGGTAGDWRREFEEVCARTQDAMALGADELRRLVTRCDELKPALERLEESERKVYSRRLEACRGVYQFVLDTR